MLTIEDTVVAAQTHLNEAETDCEIEEVVADKGYHSEDSLDRLQNESGKRTYIPQPQRTNKKTGKKSRRRWQGKPARTEAAYRRNRRNTRGERGRRLQRLRSEKVERTFAHLCDTGGARRTWLRGLKKVQKRYLTAAMAYNLGRILRSLLGAGKPRYLAVLAKRLCLLYFIMTRRHEMTENLSKQSRKPNRESRPIHITAAQPATRPPADGLCLFQSGEGLTTSILFSFVAVSGLTTRTPVDSIRPL